MRHELKTWPEFFDAVWRGTKTFEVRRDDRGFQVGDELLLVRWQPAPHMAFGGIPVILDGTHCYDGNGATILARVTYKMPGGRFGLDADWCVLGLAIDAAKDGAP